MKIYLIFMINVRILIHFYNFALPSLPLTFQKKAVYDCTYLINTNSQLNA